MISVNERHDSGTLYLSDEYIDHKSCEDCGGFDICRQFRDVQEAVEYYIREWDIEYLERVFGEDITLTIGEVQE